MGENNSNNKLVSAVKPSDIDLSNRLIGSGFGKSEDENNAALFVFVCKENGDEWLNISPEEYLTLRLKQGANPTLKLVQSILKDFSESGYMTEDQGKYSITDKFIGAVSNYIK